MFKHTGHENEGNDHQRRHVLIFNQILLTGTTRYVDNSEESMHVSVLPLHLYQGHHWSEKYIFVSMTPL